MKCLHSSSDVSFYTQVIYTSSALVPPQFSLKTSPEQRSRGKCKYKHCKHNVYNLSGVSVVESPPRRKQRGRNKQLKIYLRAKGRCLIDTDGNLWD
ncbi:hypothetical protein PoB_003509100 [Plakobranchus ocellatus]|uniref:Uncharacterized protein n=1 Tax=Plakobranchus ocellatus TaxID=259542 RepID=A0AAV4AJX1_9GAST|nr:hypothetical protein PoB_003509100 [Plakobranchus ocellatus]